MHLVRRDWIGVAGFQHGVPSAVGTWRRRASRPAHVSSLQRSHSVDWFRKIVPYQRSPDSLENHLIVDDNNYNRRTTFLLISVRFPSGYARYRYRRAYHRAHMYVYVREYIFFGIHKHCLTAGNNSMSNYASINTDSFCLASAYLCVCKRTRVYDTGHARGIRAIRVALVLYACLRRVFDDWRTAVLI